MAHNAAVIEVSGLDDLARKLELHDQQVKRVIAGEVLYAKPEAEAYAKKNAPWTDRSGNARAGLHADAKSINGGEAFELILAHSVYYGIFLETRFSGKYAIIMPTMNYIGKLLLKRIDSALARAGDMSV